MKKWFNSKEKLFSLIIALIITFAYVNLLFSIIEKIKKFSWITEIVVTLLLVSFVALVIIGLTEDGDRFRVIINKSNINILRLIVILLIAFSLSYIVILLTTGTEFLISHLSTNGIWGIITLIFSLLLFWFGIMKKVQILEVKVSVSGNKFKDELPLLTSDDELKVRVLCDGKNTDIVKFQGFCLSTEIDKIENSINKNWKDIILLPKYSNGQLLITSEEQVKPHELSSEYVISRRSIINTLNELKMEDIRKNLKDGCIKLYTLYTDSNGIYFSKLILLKYDNIKMDKNKKVALPRSLCK